VLTEIHDQGARTVFIQPQYSDQVVRSLARDADLAVVVLDPLARDHLANLRHLGETIAAGLEVRP
jgi:ABC-type Zn2+ transport system substrate-binding protein/surface adhesin